MVLAAATVMTGVTGCGSSGGEAPAETTKATEAAGTEAESTTAAGAEAAVDVKSLPAGSIDLSIMLPLGQWTDNFNVLIDDYKSEHPEIGEIIATFPSSDKYDDLLISALSTLDTESEDRIGGSIVKI